MPTVTNYNPDVLSCLANLSSDEVFTPPDLANRMLDLLPAKLWRNPKARFLDPACKSGVFLREIARRLDKGLETNIPDRQERINHIMKNQLFGIAITELTGLMSRRSLYCSKTANGKYSVCTAFDTPEGNIRYRRIEHTWKDGRCTFCGANEENYARAAASLFGCPASECALAHPMVSPERRLLLCHAESPGKATEQVLPRLQGHCGRWRRSGHWSQCPTTGAGSDGRSPPNENHHPDLWKTDYRRHGSALDGYLHAA